MSVEPAVGPEFGVFSIVYSTLVVCLSCAFFYLLAFLANSVFCSPLWTFNQNFKPGTNNYSETKWRKMLNLTVSWLHSCISGPAALISMYLYPEMCGDILHTYNDFTRNLMLFVIGYFAYDSLDNVSRHRATTWILVHHAVMIFTFAISAVPGLYLGYGAVGLLMELNSIFLHMRVLMKMHDCDKTAPLFSIICWINIGTFVLFRIVVMVWMSHWLMTEGLNMYSFHLNISRVGLFIMWAANLLLFYQVLTSDGYIGGRKIINID